jgi:ComF family protein
MTAAATGWKSWLEAAVGFFYPEICQLCGAERATAAEGYVCGRCWSRPGAVRFIRPPYCERCGLPFEGQLTTRFECSNCREMKLNFSQARAAVVASDLVLEVIHRYKYQRALWFEPFLAELLVRQAADPLRREGWDWIVPVPLYSVKQREREFNQAERLAARLSANTGIPVNRRLVCRVAPTRTQTLLNRAQRARNVRDAFAARPGVDLHGDRVVLVDDVLTTGATTSACAGALRDAGAGEVCVWTVARGL